MIPFRAGMFAKSRLYGLNPLEDCFTPISLERGTPHLFCGAFWNSTGMRIYTSKLLMNKVCHVTTVDLSVRFLLLNQLCYLQHKGIEVHVVCSDGKWLPQVEEKGIIAHRVKMKRSIAPLADLIALYRLYRVFFMEKFDIVHLHTPKASLLGAIAAKLARVPHVVYTIHGFYFHDGMSRFPRLFYFFWEKIKSFCIDFALSVSRLDVDTAIREGLYTKETIEVLGSGIDVEYFDPTSIDRERRLDIMKSLSLPERCRVLGIVARLVREKGFIELFRAAKILAEEFPDLYLLVVGPTEEGKNDKLSTDLAWQFGIGEKTVFTGMRLDLPALYSIMDLFVLPSYREGFPRVIMEASAMGLPVVASDIRGCREAVEDGKTGILVPVGDPEALAKAIARILREPYLARNLGEAGRKKALDDFDEERVFRTVLKKYESLMGSIE